MFCNFWYVDQAGLPTAAVVPCLSPSCWATQQRAGGFQGWEGSCSAAVRGSERGKEG